MCLGVHWDPGEGSSAGGAMDGCEMDVQHGVPPTKGCMRKPLSRTEYFLWKAPPKTDFWSA